MNRLLAIAGLLLGLTLGACALFHVFPAQVMEGVDENFGFTAWRMVPNARVGQKVQLGGGIWLTKLPIARCLEFFPSLLGPKPP